MSKKNVVFLCQTCGFENSKWLGQCPSCGEWNSFVEFNPSAGKKRQGSSSLGQNLAALIDGRSKKVSEIKEGIEGGRSSVGLKEFDRVLGGGLVEGSLVLIGGEPGVGKSTMLSQVAASFSKISHSSVLYISGEESENQIANRLRRLKIEHEEVYLLHETYWQEMQKEIERLSPKLVIIDSIQTTVSTENQSPPGSISQTREVTFEILNFLKPRGISGFIVGHITKEGSIAGPKVLEHMVDTVLVFEGDQFGQYRLLRSIKNRFGNTHEVGIFEMGELGLNEVDKPSQLFLDPHLEGSFGRAITCLLEGSRCLFVEVQALVVENKFVNGRRTTQGFDSNRLAMLIAVVEKYCNIPLGQFDIYVNIIGGLKITGRETDLAVVAAILSSYFGVGISPEFVFLGEVGLTGEVRSVSRMEQRVKELRQLSYKRLYTSDRSIKDFKKTSDLTYHGLKVAREILPLFQK
jgi:DNA repair protein RadA/Sms